MSSFCSFRFGCVIVHNRQVFKIKKGGGIHAACRLMLNTCSGLYDFTTPAFSGLYCHISFSFFRSIVGVHLDRYHLATYRCRAPAFRRTCFHRTGSCNYVFPSVSAELVNEREVGATVRMFLSQDVVVGNIIQRTVFNLDRTAQCGPDEWGGCVFQTKDVHIAIFFTTTHFSPSSSTEVRIPHSTSLCSK